MSNKVATGEALRVFGDKVVKPRFCDNRRHVLAQGPLTKFISATMKRVVIKQHPDGFWAEIPGWRFMWVVAKTKVRALALLQQILEEWLINEISKGRKPEAVSNEYSQKR